MHRQVPDASISVTVLLLYVGVLCAIAVAVLVVRWWLRFRDSQRIRNRSYSERLAVRFNHRRESLRQKAKKKQGRHRP
ncbi:MAG: hypothetical protein EON56_02505 [Alphaproteobacteria bacterium]|nr:MAG: hypothetical protein EON56_02505 [Alphaproteobacteria bacterium]